MTLDDLKPGQHFCVIKAPPTCRNRFVADEIVIFKYFTYNTYDGYPMFFFEDRPGTQRTFGPGDKDYNYDLDVVWCGAGTTEEMLADWGKYFEAVKK